ncbi:MAG: response regulator [bacterium]
MSQQIILVEDEQHIRDNYAEALMRSGYSVQSCESRIQALSLYSTSGKPDMFIIDIGLVDEIDGGFKLCQQIRAEDAHIPIIFLTARDSEIDEISALRMGADDYVTKDATLPQLLARVAALFRRIEAQSETTQQKKQVGQLFVDGDRVECQWSGYHVGLTVTEFWIVDALAEHPGHVKNRQQLMKAAQIYVDDATITSHIKRIRKKFKQVDAQFEAIEAVHGLGYRWRTV